MKKLSALLLSTSMLAACQQGATNYENNQNTYQGAAIGAALGGLAGALTGDGDRLKRGAIGAGIGALAGGGIGAYMDSQEADLRAATAGTGIDVTRSGDNLYLNMPSNITFAYNSSDVGSALKPTLNNVADILADYPQTIVEVQGHTDSTGSDSYNLQLSEDRAHSVGDYLLARGLSQRVITTGLGENSPIASNDTEDGRAQNRRVEVKISPLAQ